MESSRGKRRREASVGAADVDDARDDDGLRVGVDDLLHLEMAAAIAVQVSSLAPKRGRQGAKSYAPSAQAADQGSEESRKLEESRKDWVGGGWVGWVGCYSGSRLLRSLVVGHERAPYTGELGPSPAPPGPPHRPSSPSLAPLAHRRSCLPTGHLCLLWDGSLVLAAGTGLGGHPAQLVTVRARVATPGAAGAGAVDRGLGPVRPARCDDRDAGRALQDGWPPRPLPAGHRAAARGGAVPGREGCARGEPHASPLLRVLPTIPGLR